jgi:aminopeptidase YwaD
MFTCKNTDRMKRTAVLFVNVVIFIFIFVQTLPSQPVTPQLIERLREDENYLASDSLEGRLAASPGNEKARDYILAHFKQYGLEPVDGKYLQPFPYDAGLKLGDKNEIEISVIVQKPGIPPEMLKPIMRKWVLGEEWHPMRFSENGTVSGELVFAGYGMTAKDLHYDDYEGIDVKGKIVIVLADSAEGQPLIKEFQPYSELSYKATNAREHGAAGIIFIKTLSDSANTYYKFYYDRFFQNSGIIAVQANRTMLAKLFPYEKPLLDLEKKINKERVPQSFVLPRVKISISVDIKPDVRQIDNVVGMVKGSDPKLNGEYFVAGAHFDHLGWGGTYSHYKGKIQMIHNGADDNASGTSAIIELASQIASKPLRRSLIFIAFNAEEEGLLGSSYFANNSPVPLEKTEFMLNLDMVGRMKDNRINVMGTGSSPEFAKITDSLATADSLTLIKVQEAYSPSDNASFYSKNIPVLFLFTDLHTDYHRPSDKVDKINFEGLGRATMLTEQFLRAVDNYDSKPEYIKVASPDTAGKEQTPGKGYGRVSLGVVPDFATIPNGLRITGTVGGSPAEKAGLKDGDVLTKIGDKTIKNLFDLSQCLKEHNTGDEVIIIFVRDGKERKVKCTLEARK